MKPPWSRGYNLVSPLDRDYLMGGGKDMFYRGIFLSMDTWQSTTTTSTSYSTASSNT